MKPNVPVMRLLAGSALATILLAPAAPALAQTQSAATAPTLEEIVVTAGLRPLLLQEAPMSVSAVSAEEFDKFGFRDPSGLQFLSPSIQVSLQGANAIYIRGSGTNSQNGGTEQSVGLVIDGVLQGFVDDIGGDISDLDRAEIYRGPQGTQFAKNASAGVVSLISRNPKIGELSYDLHGSYGEWGDTVNSITTNIPINANMAARFTLGYQKRDGIFENVTLKERQAGRSQKSARGKLLWNGSNGMTALLAADIRSTWEQPNFPQAWAACGPAGPTTAFVNVYGTTNLPPCNGALLAGITPSPTNTQIVERDDAYRHTDTGGTSLQITYPIGDHTLTSITAYRFMTRHFNGPGGSGIYSQADREDRYSGGQGSQEFRLSSPADQKLSYVGGVYLYDRDTITKTLRSGTFYGQAAFLYPDMPGVKLSQQGGMTHTHNVDISYAGFLDGSYHIDDQLQINAGFRATRDNVLANVRTVIIPGIMPQVAGGIKPPGRVRLHETGYTYHVGPQYFFTPDIQVYATFSHGYKGPLVDTTVNPLKTILPETVNMFEGGVKSQLLDRRLSLNLIGFREKFKNYQVNTLNLAISPSQFQLGNAGGELSQGFELEIAARPSDDWTLSGGLTYNDSHYTEFLTQCWNSAEPIKQATSGKNGCFVRPGQTAASADAGGTPLINSSKYTYRFTAGYTHEFPSLFTVDVSATYMGRSKWLSQPMDPNIVNPGYGVLNLNAGISTTDGNYRIGIFARNALDKFFLAGRQPNGGGWTNVLNNEAVRTVGFTLDAKF